MLKKLILFLTLLFVSSMSFAQTGVDSINVSQSDSLRTDSLLTAGKDTIPPALADSLAAIKKFFEAFEYGEVIKSSNRILLSGIELSKDNLIQLYRMKGISHYSLTEDQAAKESFTQILKIDSSFTLDSAKTSPKIITYFKDIKDNYMLQLQSQQVETVIRVDTILVPITGPALQLENHIRQTLFRSIVFPGLGHLYDGRTTSGWILTSLTALSLGSTIFYIIDSNKRENIYLAEKNPIGLGEKYRRFNESYNYRNISIAALAAVWLYSQLDLFLFSEKLGESEYLKINPSISGLNLRLNF